MLPVWFLSLYVIVVLISVVYCLWMAITAWSRPHIRGARMLSLMMLVLAGWLGFIPVFMLSPTAEIARFAELYLRYAFISAIAVTFTGFTLEYAVRPRLLRRWLMIAPLVPLAIHLLHWLDPTWMVTELTLTRTGPYWMISQFVAGPGYKLMALSMYGMIGIGFIVLIQRFRTAPLLYKMQVRTLLFACMIPLFINLVFVTRLVPLPELDWAALSFVATAYLLTRSLFRYRLFNLMPVAYQMIVQSMDEAVIVVDLDQRVIQINPAAERLLQRQSRELVGESIVDAFQGQCSLLGDLLTAQPGSYEFTLGDPPQYFEVQLSGIQYLGAPIGRMGIVRNITARKRQEIERERLIVELDAFAHTAAHDLKSPLGTVTGYVGMLEQSWGSVPPEQADLYLRMIGMYSRKMAMIVDELLLLARTRSADDIPIMPMDARSIAQSAIDRLAGQIAEAQAAISFEGDVWPLVVGYPPWIEEVWANYISNAVKYGGTPPQVTIGCERLAPAHVGAPNHIRFWVRDNGSGLTPEQQARLFKQFTRLEPTRAMGTGLGLTIAQRIIERLNGTVGVISAPEQGSTFYFSLPTHDGDLHALPSRSEV